MRREVLQCSDVSDMAIQKISFDKRDASSTLKATLLLNVQKGQDLRMLNVFCATRISLQIIRDVECIKNYKRTYSQHLGKEQ